MNPIVSGMALMRILSGAVELTAAILMLRFNQVETALRINGLLGLVGPAVLVLVSIIGLAGLASDISPTRTMMIVLGIFLIYLGTR